MAFQGSFQFVPIINHIFQFHSLQSCFCKFHSVLHSHEHISLPADPPTTVCLTKPCMYYMHRLEPSSNNNNNNKNNNNSSISRCVREVVYFRGLSLHWSSPTQVCNSATWGTGHALPCTQDCPVVLNNYIRTEVSQSIRNTADLHQNTSKNIPESKV